MMNINYNNSNYSIGSITSVLSLIILCLFLSNYADAKEQDELNEQQKTFITPPSLTTAKPQSSEEALALLNSNTFHEELRKITEQLSQETIEQSDMFNKVALLSILEKHTQLKHTVSNHKNSISYTHYNLHSNTQIKTLKEEKLFKSTLTNDLKQSFSMMSDEELYQTNNALGWSVLLAQDYAFNIFKRYQAQAELTLDDAMQLIVNSHLYRVLEKVIPVTQQAFKKENAKRYIIEPEVLITTPEGIELAVTIVRKKGITKKLPTAFQFTIYADESAHIKTAIHAAAHGYIGVIANSRGKRSSTNKITPWVYEGKDATSVIEWITKQPWSDGKVAMYGGSYNGFTQWAAAKYMHPALKAIAPYAAASLITGLPYENNIALTGNYQWAGYVTNNKTVDDSVYANWQQSNDLIKTLFESGRAFKDIEELDGKENPLFQEWLQHPGFDEYYQDMVPVKAEYAEINIPVLSVTGYFDGGQISAVDYLTRHYKYNENADHTLLIGPYNHGSAQGIPRSHYSNYQLDDVALEKDTEEIVFDWFDHLFFDKPKPNLLKDKVNYQLMGSNTWQHKPSLNEMNKQSKRFFLNTQLSDKIANQSEELKLQNYQESKLNYVQQTVDMSDRSTQHNQAPWPVIQDSLNESNGLVYITETFETDQALAGAISGYFSIAVNKKDVDIGYNFYEIDKDGKAFHLNNYRSRASYADDMNNRQLLTPNQKTIVPIINARMTAKLIKKGSKLAIVLNVNKNVNAQVNMGSGKDVSIETIADAGEPLTIKWYNDTQINIPLTAWIEE